MSRDLSVRHARRLTEEALVAVLSDVPGHARARRLLSWPLPEQPAGTLLVSTPAPDTSDWSRLSRAVQSGWRLVLLHEGLAPQDVARVFDVGASALVDERDGLVAVLDALTPSALRAVALEPRRGRPTLALEEAERRALSLFARGLGAQAVARRLDLSSARLEAVRRSACLKLGARHHNEAVAEALRLGLLDDLTSGSTENRMCSS